MAVYPQNATGLNYITYPVGPTPLGVTLTSSASANTKGAYLTVAASTAFACNRILIECQFSSSNAGFEYLLDLAIGAAASEVVIVPNIPLDGTPNSTLGGFAIIDLPIAIPSGTRIAARCQCTTGSSGLGVLVSLVAAGGQPGIATNFVNYGANTATSGGVAIDPGGSANTKGAWAELTSSTSAVTQCLALAVAFGGNTAPQSARWYFDIGIGGSGSEVVLIADVAILCLGPLGTSWILLPKALSWLTYIASGTRIAVRASCSITDATDRVLQVALLAGTAPSEPSGIRGGSWAFA